MAHHDSLQRADRAIPRMSAPAHKGGTNACSDLDAVFEKTALTPANTVDCDAGHHLRSTTHVHVRDLRLESSRRQTLRRRVELPGADGTDHRRVRALSRRGCAERRHLGPSKPRAGSSPVLRSAGWKGTPDGRDHRPRSDRTCANPLTILQTLSPVGGFPPRSKLSSVSDAWRPSAGD